jgi:hypothetical protein
MSFIFGKPKMPELPKLEMPKVEDVPNYEDATRKEQLAAAQREADAKRRGRSSTILTTGTGLNDDPELESTTLLGG